MVRAKQYFSVRIPAVLCPLKASTFATRVPPAFRFRTAADSLTLSWFAPAVDRPKPPAEIVDVVPTTAKVSDCKHRVGHMFLFTPMDGAAELREPRFFLGTHHLAFHCSICRSKLSCTTPHLCLCGRLLWH